MMRRVTGLIVRHSLETAVQTTAETATTATTKSFVRMFEVTLPTSVYVRASNCEIVIRRCEENRVELSANLRVAFGWDLAAEQDSAGVYIAATRKRVLGKLSSAYFTLVVPHEATLIFHLTPGTIRLEEVDGKLTIPASSAEKPMKFIQG